MRKPLRVPRGVTVGGTGVGGRFTSLHNLTELGVGASDYRSIDKLVHVAQVQLRAAERREQFLADKFFERGTLAARRAMDTARMKTNEARATVANLQEMKDIPIDDDDYDVEAVEWELGISYEE